MLKSSLVLLGSVCAGLWLVRFVDPKNAGMLYVRTYVNSFYSEKIESTFKKFENSSWGKFTAKIKNFSSDVAERLYGSARDTFIENRKGNVTPEFEEIQKRMIVQATDLENEAGRLIRVFEGRDGNYKDKAVLYAEGIDFIADLKEKLSVNVRTILEARKLQKSISSDLNNIFNVLNDDLIQTHVLRLRQTYADLKNEAEKIEATAKKRYSAQIE